METNINGNPVLTGQVIATGIDKIKIKKEGRVEEVQIPVVLLMLDKNQAKAERVRYRLASDKLVLTPGSNVVCETIKWGGDYSGYVVIHQVSGGAK